MTAQMTTSSLGRGRSMLQAGWIRRSILFVVFLLCEFAIIVLGSNYYKVFATNQNLGYNLAISAVFLAASLWLRRTERWSQYWRVAFAFFVASVANPSTWLLDERIHRFLIDSLALVDQTSQYLGVEKVFEVALVVVPILLLTKLSGADLGSIYIKRGNLKLGLGVGLLVFFFLVPASFMFAAQRFTSLDALGAAVVWGLVFSFANAFMEELWLRGIFLRHLEPFLKAGGAVLVTAIVFALMHGFAFYFMPAALPFYMLNTLSLGIACGYLMMKADSIWGPVVIHAASDFFLFIALLANA